MVNNIGALYPSGSNERFSSKFCGDYRVPHKKTEEGRMLNRPKRYEYNNKDVVNSPNILRNNNYLFMLLYSSRNSYLPFNVSCGIQNPVLMLFLF